MTSRYDNRFLRIIADETYREILKKRNVTAIKQYSTPSFKYPTTAEMSDLHIINHAWKIGDRFYKLADEYYNDPKLWWVIAWFNRTPTEAQFTIGEIVNIPLPLEEILQILDI